jgi:hypothetical protein
MLKPSEGEFYLTPTVHNKLTEIEQPWLLNWPKKV